MPKKKAAKKATPKAPASRMGRPPKFDQAVIPTSVGFTPEQLELLEQAVRISGRKRSELLRDASLAEARRIVEEAKRKPE